MSNGSYFYSRPFWHHKRPSFLEDAISACKKLNQKKYFLSKIGKISTRQFEGLRSFCQAILHYTDLASLQYGIWDKKEGIFKPFDLKILKKATNLSSYYFYGAIKILKSAGYLITKRKYKKVLPGYINNSDPDYGKAFKAFPSERKLSDSFFIDLGFSKDRLKMNQISVLRKREDKIRTEKGRKEIRKSSIRSNINFYASENINPFINNKLSDKGRKYLRSIKYILNGFIKESGP